MMHAQDTNDIDTIFECAKVYGKGSGGKANIEKTEILPIGKQDGESLPLTLKEIRMLPYGDPVRLLGIKIGNKVQKQSDEIWKRIIENSRIFVGVPCHGLM